MNCHTDPTLQISETRSEKKAKLVRLRSTLCTRDTFLWISPFFNSAENKPFFLRYKTLPLLPPSDTIAAYVIETDHEKVGTLDNEHWKV